MEITNEIYSIITVIMIYSCEPQELFEEQEKTIKVDSSYYFNNMTELELETQQMVDESIAYDYGKQFICPNCGEPFDGHECENCKYTEER